jgi:hypothetical protein
MSARQFKLTAPVPLERDIHEQCARALDALLLPPALWFAYPAGASQLSPQQQARHSRIGLKRGLPDIFVLHGGAIYGIELKRPGSGRLSRTRIVRTRRGSPYELIGQEEMFQRLVNAGVREIAIATSVTEMLGHLERWGVPLRGMVAA